MNETDGLIDVHPDVMHVIRTYTPGDMACLGVELGSIAFKRYLRMQLQPWLPYAETDARWIMQAFRNWERRVAEIEKEHKDAKRIWNRILPARRAKQDTDAPAAGS